MGCHESTSVCGSCTIAKHCLLSSLGHPPTEKTSQSSATYVGSSTFDARLERAAVGLVKKTDHSIPPGHSRQTRRTPGRMSEPGVTPKIHDLDTGYQHIHSPPSVCRRGRIVPLFLFMTPPPHRPLLPFVCVCWCVTTSNTHLTEFDHGISLGGIHKFHDTDPHFWGHAVPVYRAACLPQLSSMSQFQDTILLFIFCKHQHRLRPQRGGGRAKHCRVHG